MGKAKKIKAGVVGVGYLGEFHLQKYIKHPEVDFVGCVESNSERRLYIQNKYQVPCYDTLEDLIHQNVQAVSIVVPTTLHYSVSKFLIERKIDVLVEKPITDCVEKANELIHLAKKNKCILQVGHIERFNPVLKKGLRYVKDPFLIECQRLSPVSKRGIDVDIVLDLMIHDIDLVLGIVKSSVKKVSSSGTNFVTTNCDLAKAHVEFENGCVAHFSASRLATDRLRQMKVFQKNSYVLMDFQNNDVKVFDKNLVSDDSIKGVVKDSKVDPLNDEILWFIECVQNRTKPVVSGEDGLRALSLAFDIMNQIKTTYA